MSAFLRKLIPLWCALILGTFPSPGEAKPTREQVMAFAAKCKVEEKPMDLIAEFGSDFSGLDLSGLDFCAWHYRAHARINLRGANFSNANLHRTEFGSIDLDGADFTGADLSEAYFNNVNLPRATFARTNLKGTQFYFSNFFQAKLIAADLSTADLRSPDFTEADLTDAVFSGAQTTRWQLEFTNANLTRAKLAGLDLNNAEFHGTILRSADLSGASLIEAEFIDTDLTGASLQGANVESAIFRNVQGLSETEVARLTSEAQRWKFELKQGAISLLKAMYLPTYLLVIFALFPMSASILRLPEKSPSAILALAVNVFTFLPLLALLCMILVGASATMQGNAGSSSAMSFWSLWVSLWPPLIIAQLAALALIIIVALVFTIACLRRRGPQRAKLILAYVVLTIAHCFFAAYLLSQNFPSA